MNVKAVVFDLGKVLVDFDYKVALQKIAARSRITHADISEFMGHAPLLLKYETGLLTNEEFFTAVCDVTGYCGTLDEFALTFGDIFTVIEPMIDLQKSLRQAGLPTYIFSNTNDLAIRHIRQAFPFFSNFDGYIFSYQHRSMKPEARLYEIVEQSCGRQGPEILYLDDRQENIDAGARRGWQVILQETPEKSRAAIRSLGLLP